MIKRGQNKQQTPSECNETERKQNYVRLDTGFADLGLS
jgi:hypothetical protein